MTAPAEPVTQRVALAKRIIVARLAAARGGRVDRAALREVLNEIAEREGWPKRATKGAAGGQALSKAVNRLKREGTIDADEQQLWAGPAWREDTACRRKIAYTDVADALAELARLQGARQSSGWEPRSVYFCQICRCWHLTSKPARSDSDLIRTRAAVPA